MFNPGELASGPKQKPGIIRQITTPEPARLLKQAEEPFQT
jgi:hypothetical protein